MSSTANSLLLRQAKPYGATLGKYSENSRISIYAAKLLYFQLRFAALQHEEKKWKGRRNGKWPIPTALSAHTQKEKKKKTAGGRAGECSILMAHHHLIFVIRASTSKSKDYNELPDFNYERGDGSYRLKTRQKISTGLKPRRWSWLSTPVFLRPPQTFLEVHSRRFKLLMDAVYWKGSLQIGPCYSAVTIFNLCAVNSACN